MPTREKQFILQFTYLKKYKQEQTVQRLHMSYGMEELLSNILVFGRELYRRDEGKLGKFEARIDEGIFLRYSTRRKAY